jgi:6,7-dimethyl-8-ribityllumazine synthase
VASSLKNLSDFTSSIPSLSGIRIGIVVAEWNNQVTYALRDGAIQTLKQAGVTDEHILVTYVPGSFELPLGAQFFLENNTVDAVICIGCVIQGETPHFTFISEAVAQGIMRLNLDYNRPVIFGVLTTLTLEQALERSGGKHGNKGDEAAFTALKMLALQNLKKY